MKVGIIGAGWAGLSAAVTAVSAGHAVTVYEASRWWGGRARMVPGTLPDGSAVPLDNGQHILIGAYRDTLALMRRVGTDPDALLLRQPLCLVFPDGHGLRLPRMVAPLDAVLGIAGARGWTLADKASLLARALRWRWSGFRCAEALSVAQLCEGLPVRVMQELVEPLCVSALNTPASDASAQVFLRILRDSVLGATGASHLLLPRVDLSTLFPDAAAAWLHAHGAQLRRGERAGALAHDGRQWSVDGQRFDALVLATGAPDAARLLNATTTADAMLQAPLQRWAAIAGGLQHTAIATVYAWGRDVSLAHPMLALRGKARSGDAAPAQFVFDRGQLGGSAGLLAFVVSASDGSKEELQTQVLAQARAELGLDLQPLQTVVEKRATFACTPGLDRPAMQIGPGLLACGDYVQGPYPATLEGAVRSGVAAAEQVAACRP